MRDGSVADINQAYHQPTAWKNVSSYSLDEVEPKGYRLKVDGRQWIFTHRAIDAEIECSREQAHQLRQLLRGWIGGSKER